MDIKMRFLPALLGLVLLGGAQCLAEEAQSPVGEWLVKDKTAHVRIISCEEKLWGALSWVNEPDTDKYNPDATKRNRPILGLPILLGFQPDNAGKWNGEIYNAENGKIYTSNIHLKSANIMHVEGCLLRILCGGEDWTRVKPSQQDSDITCKQVESRMK